MRAGYEPMVPSVVLTLRRFAGAGCEQGSEGF